MDINQEIGKQISIRRAALGISQTDLAELVAAVAGKPINQVWVQRREQGAVQVSIGDLLLLADALKCSPLKLLPETIRGRFREQTPAVTGAANERVTRLVIDSEGVSQNEEILTIGDQMAALQERLDRLLAIFKSEG